MGQVDHIRERHAGLKGDTFRQVGNTVYFEDRPGRTIFCAFPGDQPMVEFLTNAPTDIGYLLEKVRLADELAQAVDEYYGPPAVRLALTAYKSE